MLSFGTTRSLGCDFDKIDQVWIAPSPTFVPAGAVASVAAVVRCRAAADDEGEISFSILLLDDDRHETTGVDRLESQQVFTKGFSPSADVPVVAAAALPLYCETYPGPTQIASVYNGDDQVLTDEGTPVPSPPPCKDPADLALEIGVVDPSNVFNMSEPLIPAAGHTPACCRETWVEVFRGLTGFIPGHELTPPDGSNLPIPIRAFVKDGMPHLEFVEKEKGPFPVTVTVSIEPWTPYSISGSQHPASQEDPLSIRVTGSGPFVTVEGTVGSDGTINASGRGEVAGYPGIAVTMTGTLRGDTLAAEYSMGAQGGLPGGYPIVFGLEGTSSDFESFWEDVAQAMEATAQEIARLNTRVSLGGPDLGDTMIRVAGNLLVAQAGLRYPQQSPEPTLAGLRGMETRLNELADGLNTSTLPGRDDVEAKTRAAADACGQAAALREDMNQLLQGPPSPALAQNMAAWLDALSDTVEALNTFLAAAVGEQFAVVSAASFTNSIVAAGQIVSGFGSVGAPLEVATEVPLPTTLGGMSIRVTDSADAEHAAGIFFSSAGQFNFAFPENVAEGMATATVFREDEVIATGQVIVQPVAPGIFTANTDGAGAPAALIQRIAADGTVTFRPVFSDDPLGSIKPIPIDFGPEGDQLVLLLFGTGFRGASEVKVFIDDEEQQVLGFAEQGEFVGLDQANVALSRSLNGRGEVSVRLTADNMAANEVKLAFQ